MAGRLFVSFQIAATSDSRALGSSSLGDGICCLWASAFIRRDMPSPFSGTSLGKFPCILPTCLGPTEAWSCLAKVNGFGRGQLNGAPSGVCRCFSSCEQRGSLESPVSTLPAASACAVLQHFLAKEKQMLALRGSILNHSALAPGAGAGIASGMARGFTETDFPLWVVSVLVPEWHRLWFEVRESALKTYCINYKKCSYRIE